MKRARRERGEIVKRARRDCEAVRGAEREEQRGGEMRSRSVWRMWRAIRRRVRKRAGRRRRVRKRGERRRRKSIGERRRRKKRRGQRNGPTHDPSVTLLMCWSKVAAPRMHRPTLSKTSVRDGWVDRHVVSELWCGTGTVEFTTDGP